MCACDKRARITNGHPSKTYAGGADGAVFSLVPVRIDWYSAGGDSAFGPEYPGGGGPAFGGRQRD
jgi:hypothetical protein